MRSKPNVCGFSPTVCQLMKRNGIHVRTCIDKVLPL